MAETYEAFCRYPAEKYVTEDCTLACVTSGVSIKGGRAVVIDQQQSNERLKIKSHIFSSVWTGNILVLESDMTIDFIRDGCWLLKGMDDNFCVDHTVHVPMIQIISFEGDKISGIKKYWDQATVLRQLGVIGARGNAWPIFSHKEQIASAKSFILPSMSIVAEKDNLPKTHNVLEDFQQMKVKTFPKPEKLEQASLDHSNEVTYEQGTISQASDDNQAKDDSISLDTEKKTYGNLHNGNSNTDKSSRVTSGNRFETHFSISDEEAELLEEKSRSRNALSQRERSAISQRPDIKIASKRDVETHFTLYDESPVTTHKNGRRTAVLMASKRDVESHFSLGDTSPIVRNINKPDIKLASHRDVETHFSLYEETPEVAQRPGERSYLRDMNSVSWGFNDDQQIKKKGIPSRRTGPIGKSANNAFQSSWSFGDDDDALGKENSL